jgi:glutamyl-tRNA synthetase
LLHLGHARTFWIAFERAAAHDGQLIFRNEDLDAQRCRTEFVEAMFEDLGWLGIQWSEGPDCGGAFGPYTQSERRGFYLEAWGRLREGGMIYPCVCSRRDVAQAAGAPNDGDDEPVYSGRCRPQTGQRSFGLTGWIETPASREQSSAAALRAGGTAEAAVATWAALCTEAAGVNWRFRVPHGEEICFTDLHLGPQRLVAGRDFGDFIVWRRDDVPAYQLAVVVDDAAMRINEVVRGADLLTSTARQILLFRALGLSVPDYYHCDLVRDTGGVRLAKRHDSLSIRRLRELGWTPAQVRAAGTDLLRSP